MGGLSINQLERRLARLDGSSREEQVEALGQLVLKHRSAFRAIIIAFNPRLREDWEDLTQTALVNALRSIDTYRPDRGSFKRWFQKILLRTAQQELRRAEAKLIMASRPAKELLPDPGEDHDDSLVMFPATEPEAEWLAVVRDAEQLLAESIKSVVNTHVKRRQFNAWLLYQEGGRTWREVQDAVGIKGKGLKVGVGRLLKKIEQDFHVRARHHRSIHQRYLEISRVFEQYKSNEQ